MITKTIEVELDEMELLEDIEPKDMIDYLSYNGIVIDDISSLADVVNNSLLRVKDIEEFLDNLDDEIIKTIKDNK